MMMDKERNKIIMIDFTNSLFVQFPYRNLKYRGTEVITPPYIDIMPDQFYFYDIWSYGASFGLPLDIYPNFRPRADQIIDLLTYGSIYSQSNNKKSTDVEKIDTINMKLDICTINTQKDITNATNINDNLEQNNLHKSIFCSPFLFYIYFFSHFFFSLLHILLIISQFNFSLIFMHRI